jgi:hypothetical protein
MKICVLVALTTSGAAVAQPRSIKGAMTPPRQDFSELFGGGLQSRKCLFENSINQKAVSIARPVGWMRVKTGQSGKNSGSELDRGITESNVALHSESTKNANKSNENVNMPAHDWFLILLPFFILLLGGAFSMKHNAMLSGTETEPTTKRDA